MQDPHKHAQACRNLWCAVLMAVLEDFNRQYHARDIRAREKALSDARRYLGSRSGRHVAALAGVDVNIDKALEAIAMPKREFRTRTLQKREV